MTDYPEPTWWNGDEPDPYAWEDREDDMDMDDRHDEAAPEEEEETPCMTTTRSS